MTLSLIALTNVTCLFAYIAGKMLLPKPKSTTWMLPDPDSTASSCLTPSFEASLVDSTATEPVW